MALNLMERVMFLRGTGLCGRLADTALRAIAEVAEERRLDPGQLLCVEGDLGTDMFLVVEGEVEVRRLGRRPDPQARGDALGRTIVALGRGECVGEMSVLDEEPRSATVICRDAVRVLAIQKEDLRDAIALCPDLAFGLFRVLARRLRDTSARNPG